MRISARLDDERSRKLDFLAKATDQGTSEIVKRAIDALYEEVRTRRPRPGEVLRKTGFIGYGEADPDLSTRYKEELTESLSTKHGDR
jgi:hypothetical protein